MRVLIIGAGLGGLTLLHGLRAAGIEAHVFERSPREGEQPAGYGLHLNADGLAALHACLPAANWAAVDRAGVAAPNVIRFHDPGGRVLATIDKRFPEHETDPVTRRRAISRDRLREALLHGVGNEVRWDRRLVSYEVREDGVRASFEDGTRADGDLLVGADGANSRVRRQHLPQVTRQELGIVNIAGRVLLDPPLGALLPADLTDGGINNVVPAGPGWMFLSTWDAEGTDAGSRAGRYVVWAWAAAARSYPREVEHLDGARLKRLVQDRTARWSPALRGLVERTDPGTVGTVPLRTMPHLDPWTPSRVTLLGDAVHNMTPMAGIGANTALRDADELRRALLGRPGQVVDAVGAYERAMRTYANQALARSTRNARNAALAPRLNRAVFRRLLVVSSAVPPVRRRMFGATVG